jgi:hypothetical protein
VGEFEGDVGVRVEREVVTYPQERVFFQRTEKFQE